MKILLVNAPIPHRFKMFDYGDEISKESIKRRVLVGPPIALNELAGVVPNDDVRIIDQKTESETINNYDFIESYANEISEFRPDIVGFSCMMAQFKNVKELIKVTKELSPETFILVGGLYPSSSPEEFINTGADIAMIGIGKGSFKYLVDELRKDESKRNIENIYGLGIIKDDSIYFTPSLDTLSYEEIKEKYLFDDIKPNRKLTDKYDYKIPHLNKRIHYISTSQGCTHKCNFCSIWKMAGGKYFHKNVEMIIDELKEMEEYDIIRMCDANTFGNIKEVEHLFNRIIEEGLDKHMYMADVRTDLVVKHPELMRLAAKAGVKVVICGLESINDEQLKKYEKVNTVNNISEALKLLNELGFMVNGNYIVRPDFVDNDFDELEEFILDNPIFNSGFTILTPFPGTEQWEIYKDQINDFDTDAYNLTNAVMPTKLNEKEFYRRVSELYKKSKISTLRYFEKYGSLNKELSENLNSKESKKQNSQWH